MNFQTSKLWKRVATNTIPMRENSHHRIDHRWERSHQKYDSYVGKESTPNWSSVERSTHKYDLYLEKKSHYWIDLRQEQKSPQMWYVCGNIITTRWEENSPWIWFMCEKESPSDWPSMRISHNMIYMWKKNHHQSYRQWKEKSPQLWFICGKRVTTGMIVSWEDKSPD